MPRSKKRTQAELNSIFDSFVKNRTCPPIDQWTNYENLVLEKLQTETIDSVMHEKYDQADKYNHAIYDIMHQNEIFVSADKLNELQDRLQNVESIHDTETKRWDSVFKIYNSEKEYKLSEMQKKQKDEKEALKEKYQGRMFLIKFSKPSSKLLLLRNTQKNLALGKRFKEAKQVKLTADELEYEETRIAEDNIRQAVKKLKDTLKLHHDKETYCFEKHQERILEFLLAEKANNFLPLDMLIHHLKASIHKIKKNHQDQSSKIEPSFSSFFPTKPLNFPITLRYIHPRPLELDFSFLDKM